MSTNSQPVGMPVDPNAREAIRHGIIPLGTKGDNPATAGPGPTSLKSNLPERHVNPSVEDANTTPGTIPEK